MTFNPLFGAHPPPPPSDSLIQDLIRPPPPLPLYVRKVSESHLQHNHARAAYFPQSQSHFHPHSSSTTSSSPTTTTTTTTMPASSSSSSPSPSSSSPLYTSSPIATTMTKGVGGAGAGVGAGNPYPDSQNGYYTMQQQREMDMFYPPPPQQHQQQQQQQQQQERERDYESFSSENGNGNQAFNPTSTSNNTNNNSSNNNVTPTSTSRRPPISLHLPSYIFNNTPLPTLAPGGGAEVLPAGLLSSMSWRQQDQEILGRTGAGDGGAGQWYANSGYYGLGTSEDQDQYTPICIQPTQPPQAQQQQQQPPPEWTSTASPFDYPPETPTTASTIHDYSLGGLTSPDTSGPTQQQLSQSQLALQSQLNSTVQSQLQLLQPKIPNLNFNHPPIGPLTGPHNLYSATGFDLMSLLAIIAARPNPQIQLGPVDMSSSFVVVDPRRYDEPVIYVSPNFCSLTGYTEAECVGRNCRFLQGPGGHGEEGVKKGSVRNLTSHDAVKYMKKMLSEGKECQTSIVNYKKNGEAFINLVTVIPIREVKEREVEVFDSGGVEGVESAGSGELGKRKKVKIREEGDVLFQVGFQIDLAQMPNAIMSRMMDGSYIVDYSKPGNIPFPPPSTTNILPSSFSLSSLSSLQTLTDANGGRRTIHTHIISPILQKALDEGCFPVADSGVGGGSPPDSPTAESPNLSTMVDLSCSDPTSSSNVPGKDPSGNHPLSHVLLTHLPDFLHVLSLKGSFLYVAPAIKRCLGYDADELMGKSLQDIMFEGDGVRVLRELKEASHVSGVVGEVGAGGTSGGGEDMGANTMNMNGRPRSVDLLYRARTKTGGWVWVESRGRLYVEPGKGRKAILLSGRVKGMASIPWGVLAMSMGVFGGGARMRGVGEGDIWGMVTKTGILLVCTASQIGQVGRRIGEFVELDGGAWRDWLSVGGGKVVRVKDDGKLMWMVLHTMMGRDDLLFTMQLPPQQQQQGVVEGLAHPMEEDVFAPLSVNKGTSWQYELQQLRIGNQKIREEIRMLETNGNGGGGLSLGMGNRVEVAMPMSMAPPFGIGSGMGIGVKRKSNAFLL